MKENNKNNPKVIYKNVNLNMILKMAVKIQNN